VGLGPGGYRVGPIYRSCNVGPGSGDHRRIRRSTIGCARSDAGSDWQIWHVRDVASGKDLPDELHWSKAGGGTWRKDGTGFYYTGYEAPQTGEALKATNQYEKLYFHRLGTPQSRDPLVYTRSDDPDWFVAGTVTDDGHYLVIQANHGDDVQNTVLVQDLSMPGAPIVPVIPTPTAVYNLIGNIGSTFFIQTDDGAPRYRIIAMETRDRLGRTVMIAGGDGLITPSAP
jgi:prolyl oligopeptidase